MALYADHKISLALDLSDKVQHGPYGPVLTLGRFLDPTKPF